MPSGPDADGPALPASAHDHGVRIPAVGLMTMTYGESYTDDTGADG